MIEGLAAFQKKLDLFPPKVIAALRQAMELAAEETVQMMRRLAPVEDGDLRRSINWTWGAAPGGTLTMGTVQTGAKKSAGRDVLGVITVYAGGSGPGYDAFYARWVEFGTAPHVQPRRLRGGMHPGARSRPFFYPSWRVRSRATKAALTRAFKKAIREA
jgi:hypothetical protein